MKTKGNTAPILIYANTVQKSAKLRRYFIITLLIDKQNAAQIIRKNDFQACVLKDGDKVEIVNFVGGG